MKASHLILIAVLLVVILVGNIESAAAFTGENFVINFWDLIKDLINLIFFRTDSMNNPSQQVSTKKWTEIRVTELTDLEKDMLNLINQVRIENDLNPLKVDYRLVKVARTKSQDMIRNNYFDHYSDRYGSPFDMMRKIGINYYLAGENIAGAPEVELAHQQLMKSQSHRENILHSDFSHIGIGIITGGPYGKMYTQEFVSFAVE